MIASAMFTFGGARATVWIPDGGISLEFAMDFNGRGETWCVYDDDIELDADEQRNMMRAEEAARAYRYSGQFAVAKGETMTGGT